MEKKYYLIIDNNIYFGTFDLILNKLKQINSFYDFDYFADKIGSLERWHKDGSYGGTLVSCRKEKFINFYIGNENPIRDLEKEAEFERLYGE